MGACTVGAVLPDLDAFSYGLGDWGRAVYFGDHWYSHHQATHSILGCLVLAIFGALAWSWWVRRRRPTGPPPETRLVAALLFLGGLVHCLGDMPTPPGPWGGLPLLFPLERRFGGWGHAWWWHHYYVSFVLLMALLTGLVGAGLARWRPSLDRGLRVVQVAAAVVALGLAARYFAIVRFDGTGSHADKARRAVEIQAEWLPAPVHAVFVKASSVLPANF